MPKNTVDHAGNSHVCRRCKKTFTNPLKVTNMQEASEEPYDACPFCLTKISADNDEVEVVLETETENEVVSAKVGGVSSSKPSNCPHHLGYLSEPAHKDKFGDECLVCPVILQCMKK